MTVSRKAVERLTHFGARFTYDLRDGVKPIWLGVIIGLDDNVSVARGESGLAQNHIVIHAPSLVR